MTAIAFSHISVRPHAPVEPEETLLLIQASRLGVSDVLKMVDTSIHGLSDNEADARLEKYGPNQIARETHTSWPWRLLRAVRNPLVILLSLLASISFATGDTGAASVMLGMVVVGLLLRFVQETRADAAAARLRAMIHVTATVIRAGRSRELALEKLVPGDVVQLSAGDMVPADVRIIAAKDLFLIQSSLTGEAFPVEKFEAPDDRQSADAIDRLNICFMGTSVERGSATAVVLATGPRTYFGRIAHGVTAEAAPTSFDRGVNSFTWLMIGFMAVMVPLVFVINGLTKHDWKEAFFFALAVAVGLTPEMLPMVVSVCLSKGAIAMSRRKVIVKRLSAIQNLGAMDTLCTDKTGTLTLDRVILERYCDVAGALSDAVLLDAYLISHFQTGLKSVLDRAVLDHCDRHDEWGVKEFRKVDEIPFDFSRRMMSVVVATPTGGNRLLSKGAPEELLKRCTRFELDGEVSPIDAAVSNDLNAEYESLSGEGFRVLAVAYRDVTSKTAYGQADEQGLILRGYVGFLDPPKDTAAAAICALEGHGVSVKVLSGDNALVCRKVCREVRLAGDRLLLGCDVDNMSEEQLAIAAEQASVFARLSPMHKQRIIRALQSRGHVVGFLGDGINDAPALHSADVGISVDGAVDVAKASADIILLEKDLLVLDDGVMEGRKVFANILKYIRMGASSNFGNMFSVLGASAFLPFIPMAPIQVLVNNLLYDFSQLPIPSDEVDAEQIARPRPWAIPHIRRFILFIGPISSVFDYTTYLLMLYLFNCWAADVYHTSLFQTAWFVESLMTQTLIIHVIRTNRIPFLQSRASWPLLVTTVVVMAVGALLPYTPLAGPLHFVPLPKLYWPLLALTLLCYLSLTQLIKSWLLKRRWI